MDCPKTILVRIEHIQRSEDISLIDEIDRFVADIDSATFFSMCVVDSKNIQIIDDYEFFTACVQTIKLYKNV